MPSIFSRVVDRLAGGSWFILLVVLPFVCTALIIYTMFTRFYWLALLYLAWMWVDRRTPYRGGRRLEWIKRLGLWKRAGRYFAMKLVKTAELPPGKNYILAIYPHGVLCFGGFLCFSTEAVGVREQFPGITIRSITLNINFYFPLVREILMALGFCSASSESLNHFLKDPGASNALGLVVGGASEAMHSDPGTYVLMAKRRKGVIKLAIKNGAHLVPVLVMGETDLYGQVRRPWLNRLQQRFKDLTGIFPVLPVGCGLLQDRYGLLPRRMPLTVLVGSPIETMAIDEPTTQQVDQLHEEFIRQLVALFENHKHTYIKDAENIHITFA